MGRGYLDLARRAWALHADTPFVVRPSIPVLWFGDSKGYARSPTRIVTVGLNPSKAEFPEDDPYLRFPRARNIDAETALGPRRKDYRVALDSYFLTDSSYRRWFDQGFERILEGMDASYYPGRRHTALHTDICSPLATDPTWSSLRSAQQSYLTRDGGPLWRDLMQYLAPDVIILSVAWEHVVRELTLPSIRDWFKLHSVERKNPFVTRAAEIEVVRGKGTLVVFGRCTNLPFGSVSFERRREIGVAIREAAGA